MHRRFAGFCADRIIRRVGVHDLKLALYPILQVHCESRPFVVVYGKNEDKGCTEVEKWH